MSDIDMSSFAPTIPDWFDVRKAAQVAAFFAKMEGGCINILKLAKLIYLADRRSLEQREYPITGDDLKAMKFGPLNQNTYDYANGTPANRMAEWREFVAARSGNSISLARPVEFDDLDELSRSDVRILKETWERFRSVDQWVLAHWTHKYCPEWTDPGTTSREIAYADVFRRLGKRDPEGLAREILEDRRLTTEFLH